MKKWVKIWNLKKSDKDYQDILKHSVSSIRSTFGELDLKGRKKKQKRKKATRKKCPLDQYPQILFSDLTNWYIQKNKYYKNYIEKTSGR